MKAKNVFIIIGCILVAVFLSTMIGFATNGHDRNEDNWGITQVNKDNFFKSADYTIMTKNTGDGYNVTVSDKGEIKVTGKNESGTLAKLEVHIHKSIKDACGCDVSNSECQQIYTEAVSILRAY